MHITFEDGPAADLSLDLLQAPEGPPKYLYVTVHRLGRHRHVRIVTRRDAGSVLYARLGAHVTSGRYQYIDGRRP